ncbi:MAG: HAD family hydrolase [Prevotella sp.]|nr:HAD family hydrolase [Prevotella sp.]
MGYTNIKGTKAFIFDYGGTLDSGGNHWGKVLWHSYVAMGVPVTEERFRDAYVYTERMLDKQQIIGRDFTFYQTLDAKIRIELEYLGMTSYHSQLLENVYRQVVRNTDQSRQVLHQLKKYYPIVLVSNFYGNLMTVTEEFGLSDCFDAVIDSAVVGVRKPDPQIFSLGVEALGLAAHEITVVGDSIKKDILPAQQVGCHTIWIRGEQWLDLPVDETIPDVIIHNIKQLEQLYETN